MDGGAWWAAVHGVAKSRTGLSDLAAAADSPSQFSVCDIQIVFVYTFIHSVHLLSTWCVLGCKDSVVNENHFIS